jgi:hypothetical protein
MRNSPTNWGGGGRLNGNQLRDALSQPFMNRFRWGLMSRPHRGATTYPDVGMSDVVSAGGCKRL